MAEPALPKPEPEGEGGEKGEVQTERLYLERLNVDRHLEDFHELWTSDEAVRWSIGPKKETLEESRPWMEFIMPNDINPEIDKFAIILKGEINAKGQPKMIGMVGTNRWSANSPGMETGYCLNIEYWGKGYATEAFRSFLEYYWTLSGALLLVLPCCSFLERAFMSELHEAIRRPKAEMKTERKNINLLVAKTSTQNIASQRVLQKCGARKGETLKGAYERHVDQGVKSDTWCWYFDRPGFVEEDTAKTEENAKAH